MIELLETAFTCADPRQYGDNNENLQLPNASNIAFEAGVEDNRDLSLLIKACWSQAETFTGRMYRDTLTGKVIIRVSAPHSFVWPRYPFPDAITVEHLQNGSWVTDSAEYVPEVGMIDLHPHTLYRLTQVGTVAASPVSESVGRAVTNLTLYQLIHSPQRREFKSQSAGDSSLTRENLMGLFYGSGAGVLLASEVRK